MAGAVAVIISGRDGYDAAKAQQEDWDEMTSAAYGGAWSGKEFILTHRPDEIAGDPTAIALNCDIVEAVRRAQEIAGDRDVQIISADIARQALEHDLIDELQVLVAPLFLGDGTRIFDVPVGAATTGSSSRSTRARNGASAGPIGRKWLARGESSRASAR